MIPFVIGLVVGGAIGIFIMGCMSISAECSRGEDKAKKDTAKYMLGQGGK